MTTDTSSQLQALIFIVVIIATVAANIAAIAALLRRRGWGGWKVSIAASVTAYIVASVISFCIITISAGALFGGGIGAQSQAEFEQFTRILLPIMAFGLLVTPLIYGGIFRLFRAAPFTHIAITALLAWLISIGCNVVMGGLLYLTNLLR